MRMERYRTVYSSLLPARGGSKTPFGGSCAKKYISISLSLNFDGDEGDEGGLLVIVVAIDVVSIPLSSVDSRNDST